MWWCGILSRYHIGIIAVASCALLAVLAISASRISYANAYVQSFNSTRAYQYIDRNYDATHGLVRENMDVEKYWLWTDNILAAQVLKDYDAAKSENITRTIDYYADLYHLHFRHPIGTLLDREVSFDTITNWNIVDNIWISDPDGERELQCASYGDIAFYKSIYYFKTGKINDAKTCYDKGSSMFDGIGIRDKAFDVDGGIYSTYKMALWKIASNITG